MMITPQNHPYLAVIPANIRIGNKAITKVTVKCHACEHVLQGSELRGSVARPDKGFVSLQIVAQCPCGQWMKHTSHYRLQGGQVQCAQDVDGAPDKWTPMPLEPSQERWDFLRVILNPGFPVPVAWADIVAYCVAVVALILIPTLREPVYGVLLFVYLRLVRDKFMRGG